MIQIVIERLSSFGYVAIESDNLLLGFIIEKVTNHIKNQCNTEIIPKGLFQVAVDMVVGEFLLGKKSIGVLPGFDLEVAVKSIQEGDTNITFAIGQGSSTPEQRLDRLINYLMHNEVDFVSYRTIKW